LDGLAKDPHIKDHQRRIWRTTWRRSSTRRSSSTHASSTSSSCCPHNSKLVSNPPIIFEGERSQAEEFITQWELYKGVNINNTLMRNTYQRAMLFLTYIQGPLVNKWVKGVNAWLHNQITTQHWVTNNERLWDSTIGAFNQQYADILEQEKAQAKLAKGLCWKEET
jgi:hypothetical protein